MLDMINHLDVPEIAHHSRTVEQDAVIVVYAERSPGAAEWRGHTVRIVAEGSWSRRTPETYHDPSQAAAAARALWDDTRPENLIETTLLAGLRTRQNRPGGHTMGDDDTWAYWIQWREASGRKGRRRGPFHHQDAVRRIAEDMDLWAAQLEHGTGAAGEWAWDTAHQVATLYRGDWCEEPLGHYVIEQVAPEDELFGD